MVSFGHSAFFGLGMYGAAAALLTVKPPNLWLAILYGLAGSAGAALFVAYFATRLRDIYFAITTLIFSQIFYVIIFTLTEMTGGENGLNFSRPQLGIPGIYTVPFTSETLHWFVLAVVTASYLILRRITQSPFGMVLQSIRENEARTRAIGYPVERYKIVAVMLSGLFAGLAGVLYAIQNRFAAPDFVYFLISGEAVIFNVMGGIGTLVGPFFGAAFFLLLREAFSRFFTEVLSDPRRHHLHPDGDLPAPGPARLRQALAQPVAEPRCKEPCRSRLAGVTPRIRATGRGCLLDNRGALRPQEALRKPPGGALRALGTSRSRGLPFGTRVRRFWARPAFRDPPLPCRSTPQDRRGTPYSPLRPSQRTTLLRHARRRADGASWISAPNGSSRRRPLPRQVLDPNAPSGQRREHHSTAGDGGDKPDLGEARQGVQSRWSPDFLQALVLAYAPGGSGFASSAARNWAIVARHCHDLREIAGVRRRSEQQVDSAIDVEPGHEAVAKGGRQLGGAIHQPVHLEDDHHLEDAIDRGDLTSFDDWASLLSATRSLQNRKSNTTSCPIAKGGGLTRGSEGTGHVR